MKTCLIVAGGEYSALPEDFTYDFCIVCDAGLSYLPKLKVKPDLILGDFDSYLGTVPESTKEVPVLTFPVEKDDTDTMLAVKEALKRGYDHIVISCALGNRLDHTMANLQTLAFIARNGASGEIVSEREEICTFTGGRKEFPKKEHFSFSLFAISDRCEGLTIKGAKYEVEDAELENTFPLGVSNKWEDDKIIISMKSGILLVIMSSMAHESK